MNDPGILEEYHNTLQQLKHCIQGFPSHLAAEKPNRQALLLDRAAHVKEAVLALQAGGRAPAYQPSVFLQQQQQQHAAPVAVEVTGAFAQQEYVPVAKSIDVPDDRVPTTDAVPVVTPISFGGAGMAVTAAMHWKHQAHRHEAPRTAPPGQPAAGAPVLPLYRESLEQLSELRGFRRSLENRLAAYGLEKAGRPASPASQAPPRPQAPELEELDEEPATEVAGSECSDGSMREFLDERRAAATHVQRIYRGSVARRRVSARHAARPAYAPASATAPSDLVVEDLDTVQLSDEDATGTQLPEAQHRYEEDDEVEEGSEDSVSPTPQPPPRPARPVGRWAGGAVGTGAPAALTRLQRPAGKLNWVSSIWKALERCVALLDNSQAIKASSSLSDIHKSAEMLFLFQELLPPMAVYFGYYFRQDRAEVDESEKRRILNLATRLLRGVHGLCHPPLGPECEVTEDDTAYADIALHQMLENGLRQARPLSAGHNSAIEKDARRGAARLKKEPTMLPQPTPSYARLVQQFLALAAHEQPTLGDANDADDSLTGGVAAEAEVVVERPAAKPPVSRPQSADHKPALAATQAHGDQSEGSSDEEAAAAADRMVVKCGNDLGGGMNQTWKGKGELDGSGWAPVEQHDQDEPSSPSPNSAAESGSINSLAEEDLSLDMDSPGLRSPSPDSATAANARRRVVNVGDGGSTPKEVRLFDTFEDYGTDGGGGGEDNAWEILAGGCALDQNGNIEATETMRGSWELVGLYFGGGSQQAEWACRSFEDEMRELYEAGGCEFDVLSCSANLMETEQTFADRQAELPWRTLPYGDPRPPALAKLFGIEDADRPVLVFIDSDGEVLSKDGVAEVRALLHDWRVQVAVLEGEAGLRAAGVALPGGGEGVADENESSAPRPVSWHERGEGAIYGAYFAFCRGQQLGHDDQFQTDGAAVPLENDERLAAGVSAAEKVLPPQLAGNLPVTVGGWTIATRLGSADSEDGFSAMTNSTSSRGDTSDGDLYEGEGGRVLLLSHARTGTQLAVWEDAAGFYFRRASDTTAMCLGPQCSVPTGVDQLREGQGDGGAGGMNLLSEYDVFTPTLPPAEEFTALCAVSDAVALAGGSYSWGAELHIPNDSVPWVLSVSEEDGTVLLADYAHTGGGALFLTPDGGMAFGSETATVLVQGSPSLPTAGWTQRRLSVLLDRARELSVATPDGFGAFGATHAITQGLALDANHDGLANALEVLATSSDTAVSPLELLPSRRAGWGLAEIEDEEPVPEDSDTTKRLAFVHSVSGARVTLGDQGGIHYRYAPVAATSAPWERWLSDEGWQDQSGTAGGRNAMPAEPDLAAAQYAAQSSATPVLPDSGRFAWSPFSEAAGGSSAADTAGWGLQLEDSGNVTIAHVKSWLRAWMFGQRASCVRLTGDGGVVVTDTEGGWTGLCITEGVAALAQQHGLNFLRLGGSPCTAAGWSIGVVGRSESTTAMPSMSGLLLLSHTDSGARIALREYDHAFYFVDSTSTSPAGAGPSAADDGNDSDGDSGGGGGAGGGMLWSMPGGSSDDDEVPDSPGGGLQYHGLAPGGLADGGPTYVQFEGVEQHARQPLPSPATYSWPGKSHDILSLDTRACVC